MIKRVAQRQETDRQLNKTRRGSLLLAFYNARAGGTERKWQLRRLRGAVAWLSREPGSTYRLGWAR